MMIWWGQFSLFNVILALVHVVSSHVDLASVFHGDVYTIEPTILSRDMSDIVNGFHKVSFELLASPVRSFSLRASFSLSTVRRVTLS